LFRDEFARLLDLDPLALGFRHYGDCNLLLGSDVGEVAHFENQLGGSLRAGADLRIHHGVRLLALRL
jgi:hypothetical protein